MREGVDAMVKALVIASENIYRIAKAHDLMLNRLIKLEQLAPQQAAELEALALIQRSGRRAAPSVVVPYNPLAQLPSAISPFTLTNGGPTAAAPAPLPGTSFALRDAAVPPPAAGPDIALP